jgi:uncharacterized iron-regulated membrane protein
MKPHLAIRKVHYWAAVAVAVPTLVIFSTGILLQVKKYASWVQPPEQRGNGRLPAISFHQVLAACRSVPEAGIQSWEDVNRVDVRPARGMLKVISRTNWEVQIDTASGKVLQSAYRRSDLIESLHDGSWFHESAKLWIALPTGITLLVMLLTGVYLFWLPIGVRRRKRLAARMAPGSASRRPTEPG